MSTDNHTEPYADQPPIGSFDRPPKDRSDGAADFWAVWCPQDGVFVENIWWYEFQAQQDAANHNLAKPGHTAFAYHVTFHETGGAAAS